MWQCPHGSPACWHSFPEAKGRRLLPAARTHLKAWRLQESQWVPADLMLGGGKSVEMHHSRQHSTAAAVIFWLLGLLCLGLSWPSVGAAQAPVTVEVEGVPLAMDVPPVIADGRTLVAVRFVGEAVGGQVEWDPVRRMVTVSTLQDSVVLTIGQREALVNGESVAMEVPAQLIANRTMVPLRFIAEALGCTVEWDGTTRTANILRWPSTVTGMTYETEGAAARVRISLSAPLLSVTPRTQGSAVQLDLYPAEVAGRQMERLVYDGMTRAVQLSTDGRTATLTADLWAVPPYSYTVSPDGREVILEFRPLVQRVQFYEEGRSPQVTIAATGAVAYTVQEDSASRRLILDLAEAVPAADVPAVQQINYGGLRSIRTAASPGGGTRVVLELSRDLHYDIVSTSLGLEIRFLPQLLEVKTERQADRTRLTLKGDLPMDAKVAVRDKQLLIEIPQGRSAVGSEVLAVNDSLVKAIRIQEGANPDAVLITVDLAYYISHQLVSSGGEQVVVDLINSPLYGKRIWVDAGHGWIPGGKDDPGAIGTTYGTKEKVVNLEVALALQRQLEEAGAIVYMTRTGDQGIDFRDRPAQVNRVRPPIDLFISIHHNSNTSPSVRGTETYYWTEQSWALAQYVHKAMVTYLGLPDRGVRRYDFWVVKETLAPSVLVELGYLSNPDEEYFIAEPGLGVRTYPEAAARGIFSGILDYVWQEIG